mmetsp:Transcript_15242/g.30835  ORF Transcript_15242/g.30835 Transcript_15242/m.30835 type:complete len:280 (-) Transcript_15242:334-1173(-)
MRAIALLLACSLPLHAFLLSPARWAESLAHRGAAQTRLGDVLASEKDADPPVDEEFSKGLYAELNLRMDGETEAERPVSTSDEEPSDLSAFTDELYAHLSKRPEYSTSEFYKGIKSRVDVDDPMYSELKQRREMLTKASLPDPTLGPNDVIDYVLRALQDVNYPYEGHGVEVLMNCSGSGSSISTEQSKVSPEMLYEYFETSKYRILLEWSSIQYLGKLEMSLDNKRGLQRVKMKAPSGVSVPVTFQLSKYETEAGSVWLIDQFLVKSADRRGDPAGPV